MKIIHTSDWHIGRRFERESLEDDQRSFLTWLADLVADERVDLVVVAGDVYDRSQPSEDAVAILDGGLDALCTAGAQVAMISGNHDSARRLGFGAGRQALGGVHVFADDRHPPVPRVVTARRRARRAGSRPVPRPPRGHRPTPGRRRDPPAGHPPERPGRRPRCGPGRTGRPRPHARHRRRPRLRLGCRTLRLGAHTGHRRCRPGGSGRARWFRLCGARTSPPSPAHRWQRHRRLLGLAPPLLLQRGSPEVGPPGGGHRWPHRRGQHRAGARRSPGHHPDRDTPGPAGSTLPTNDSADTGSRRD